MNIDVYLDRKYDPEFYNCAHLVCEVWKDCTAEDLSEMLDGVLCAPKDRKIVRPKCGIEFLRRPQEPCVVLLQQATIRTAPHVGVWVNGKVLHITQQGVSHVPLEVARVGFSRVRFFVPCSRQ